MSLEIFDDEVKRKHVQGGSLGHGSSVHEHSSAQLLYPYVVREIEQPDGKTKTVKEIDVDARTELPSPANTTVLERYADFIDSAFGKKRGKGMRKINTRYKVNMISKGRKGRNEYTLIGAASAMQGASNESEDLLKKVQES